MIINYFNILGVVADPAEANAPLVVNAEAVLSGPLTPELFQSVAGRESQFLQPLGGVQQDELAESNPLQGRWPVPCALLAPDFLGGLFAKLRITAAM